MGIGESSICNHSCNPSKDSQINNQHIEIHQIVTFPAHQQEESENIREMDDTAMQWPHTWLIMCLPFMGGGDPADYYTQEVLYVGSLN